MHDPKSTEAQRFMTPEALQFSLHQSAILIRTKSRLRIAALAQAVPFEGSWQPVRFDWSNEPERVTSFVPTPAPCNNHHWAA